jgi:hypothetical protein
MVEKWFQIVPLRFRPDGSCCCVRRLRDLPLFDDLPEIRRQPAVVLRKPLKELALGSVGRLPGQLLALAGLGLVFRRFGLKIGHHATPRNTRTTQDSILAGTPFEKMAGPRNFCSIATNDVPAQIVTLASARSTQNKKAPAVPEPPLRIQSARHNQSGTHNPRRS